MRTRAAEKARLAEEAEKQAAAEKQAEAEYRAEAAAYEERQRQRRVESMSAAAAFGPQRALLEQHILEH